MTLAYDDFLRNKVASAPKFGFDIELSDVNPIAKDFTKATVKWMVAGGRRACFSSFGLHKTITQIEAVRITRSIVGGMGLIVLPLGVRQEFMRDAKMLADGDNPNITDAQREELRQWQEGRPDRIPRLKFIRRIEEADDPEGIYLTNYETVRDGKLDPQLFSVSSLDEAACLRGFGGTKTFREFMALFAGDRKTMNERTLSGGVKYRYVATATPAPNDYIEMLAYSAYLGIMDVSAAKTRFFKRDSTKADHLTIHPHKEQEFWLWVASWGLFVTKPSDLSPEFSDVGYELPELDVRWHRLSVDHKHAGEEKGGQFKMFRDAACGVQDSAKEKRLSLDDRIAKMMDIRAEDPLAHRIIWHDLEAERQAIEKAIPTVYSVYGNQSDEEKERGIIGFSEGEFQELAGKPVMLGSGCNFQRYCWWAIYLGIGFKFNDWIQSVYRLQRFGQSHIVRIDLIYTAAEDKVRRILETKWENHRKMVAKMVQLVREYGLAEAAMAQTLTRAMGVERVEISGETYRIVNNDSIKETATMEENSVGLILTSIPFSTQYEYSPNYADLGHTDNNEHFFQHMDYLTPNLLRILKPGRIAAIHVKDRIVPGGMTGLGFQTVYPFHCRTIEHYCKHGFAYMGMKTIVTDVVRENNQTYRLGWTEQCKDGTKMGVGMPEYLLLFRKPPTDTVNAYADEPVVKSKYDHVVKECPWCGFADELQAFDCHYQKSSDMPHFQCPSCAAVFASPEEIGQKIVKRGYSRGRWQVDAHGFTRSSGNRLLTPEELEGLTHEQIFKAFKQFSLEQVYDFEHHVKIAEHLDTLKMLPVTFMLLQPQSWSPDVWTDITRMLTLNNAQSAKGRESHLCPMQWDLADRVVEQFSMPGEPVFDPFGGLMTVPYRAILKKRFGIACELSSRYFLDGATYCKAAEDEVLMPSLFDTLSEAV